MTNHLQKKVIFTSGSKKGALLCTWLSWMLLTTTFILSSLVYADLVLEVTQGNDKLTTVAVSPFSWTGKTLLPEDMASIIDNDLTLSGLFRPVLRKNMFSMPSYASDVFYRDWKSLGASYLVIGRIDRTHETYRVSYQLFDVVRQISVSSGEVTGHKDQLRALAHHVSDAVYKQMTGLKGDFSTRILYITANIVTPSKTEIKLGKTVITPPKYEYELKYADADGARVLTIIKSKEPIMSPCWSPTGTHVAYVSFETGRSTIFMQELKTGKREQISAFKGLNSSPSWSPDGTRIALMLSKDGNPDIYIMHLKSRTLSRITSRSAIDTEPDWMPDGKSIVFTSNWGGSAQIYQLNIKFSKDALTAAADGQPKRLTFEGKFNARAKVFPDAKSLAMVHKGQNATDFNIAIQDLDTGRIRLLTSSKLEDSPSIAPGGRRLIYSAQGAAYGELGIVSADGRVKYRLPSASGDIREPVWGPSLKL